MQTQHKRIQITLTPGLEKDLAKAKEYYQENASEVFRRALLQLVKDIPHDYKSAAC